MDFVRNKLSFYILAFVLVLFSDCKKSEKNEVDNESQSVVDCSIAGQEFVSVASNVCYATSNTYGAAPWTGVIKCDVLQYDTVSQRFYINAGQNCSFQDGKLRTGRIFVKTSDDTLDIGSRLVFSFDSYAVEGMSYNCDSIVATILEINDNDMLYDVNIINGHCQTTSNPIKYSLIGQIRNTSLYDDNKPGELKQYFVVTGVMKGVNRVSGNFSSAIYHAGIKKFRNCSYISEGFMELTPEGFKARTVDFGDGSCDDLATFRVNENTVAFKLK